MSDYTHSIDLDSLTVTATDSRNEDHDLNAEGAPIETLSELRDFVTELAEQGAFDEETRDALLEEIPERGMTFREARALLGREGLSQKEAAERLDVGYRTIQRWLDGGVLERVQEIALLSLQHDRATVYTTVKELVEHWTAEPHEWGMLGPVAWSPDEPVRFVWREDWRSWQMERWAEDRGVWYPALDKEYGDEDLPGGAS